MKSLPFFLFNSCLNRCSNRLQIIKGVVARMGFPNGAKSVTFAIAWNEVDMIMKYGLSRLLAVVIYQVQSKGRKLFFNRIRNFWNGTKYVTCDFWC
jgi:hypothetical protein